MLKNKLLFVLMSLSAFNLKAQVNKQKEECNFTSLHFENTANDTSKVIFVRGVVFDTAAFLVHGYIMDSKTLLPVKNALVKFYSGNIIFSKYSNGKGEFEIFRNLLSTQCSIKVSCKGYKCLIVDHIIQTGGQWIDFKLEHH